MDKLKSFLRRLKACSCFSPEPVPVDVVPDAKIILSRSPSLQPSSNVTAVIAHGAFQTQWHYQPFLDAIKQNTDIDRIVVPQQSSSGASPPEDSFAQDVKLLHDTVASELQSGRDVLLICHSYGGIPGCEALANLHNPDGSSAGKAGKVLGVIFVSAFVAEAGQSLVTSKTAGRASWVRIEGALCYVNNPGPTLFNLVSPDSLTTQLVERLVPQSWPSFVTPTKHQTWQEYPCWYIRCLHDQAMVPEEQDYFIARLRHFNQKAKVIELHCDHAPFASTPARLAQVTQDIFDELRDGQEKLDGI